MLVSRLERLAARFGFSEALLGLVAALTADAPEITSATVALVRGQHDIGTGIVLGSNAFNLAGVLGVGALLAGRIALHRRVVVLAGSVALVCAAAPLGLAIGLSSIGVGVAVVAPVGAYIVLAALSSDGLGRVPLPHGLKVWLMSAVRDTEIELEPGIHPQSGHLTDGGLAILALTAVVVASSAMEYSATYLGARYAVPETITGGVVLAVVTSLPNCVSAAYLALRARGTAVLSTALNSNTFNVVAGLVVPAALIGGVRWSTSATAAGIGCVALTAISLTLAFRGRGMRRTDGALILVGYALYVSALLQRS